MSSTKRRPVVDARDSLIESHLPLVRSLARRYARPGAELEDLVQVGSVALVRASDRFDPAKGVAFATFATPRIEGEIRHHLRDRSTALRIPRPLQNLSREIRRRQGELTTSLGRAPTVAEVAEALNADPAEVEQALAADEAREAVPLPVDDHGTGGPAREATVDDSDDRLIIAAAVRELDERERQIVYLRFHADQTERQIAQELGISQAQVSRLLAGALAKLRRSLAVADSAQGDIAADTAISRPSSPPPEEPDAGRHGRPSARPVAQHTPTGTVPEDDGDRLRSALSAWLASEPAEPERTVGPRRPKPAAGHSGRFLVRMPSALHEQLARAAEQEQVSLNRFVTDTLAARLSPASAPPALAPDHAAAPDGPSAERAASAPSDPPEKAAPRLSPRTVRLVLAANLVVVVFAAAVAVALLVLALQRGI